MFTPKYLNRWTTPPCYLGAEWHDYFGSGCGRSRDSEALERANFRAMLTALGFDGENVGDDCPTDSDDEPTRVIVRENHWAVGWVEWIAIHESDEAGLRIADVIAEALQDYPIIDEMLFSEIEDEDCCETWSNCFDPQERFKYLREHGVTVDSDNRLSIARAVGGDWGEAVQWLPCPSDLLC